MAEKTNRRLVCCVVVKWNDSILLIQRGERSKWSGQWCIPGGKIDPGETDEQCAVRELWEETGITAFGMLTNRRVVDSADESDVRFVIYDCVLNDRPNVLIEPEFQGYGWFSGKDIRVMQPVLMENVVLGAPGVAPLEAELAKERESARVLWAAAKAVVCADSEYKDAHPEHYYLAVSWKVESLRAALGNTGKAVG